MDQLEQLDQQIEQLRAKRQEILNKKRSQVLEQLRASIRLYGFSAHELGMGYSAGKTKSAPRDAKYVNPQNPSQTWGGGKGKRPNWVRLHLEQGGKLEELLIRH
ncbi:MAG: H-NS histone family protein [Betaproteobacteria bacterium]|nr:H-NS histone family protein [Betaproteobacteria bacterium]MDE2622225.1 H-NS histone family protein [Betaproteobacteria bacterium]